jgi:2-methylcitrate dehydratase PrpD
MEVSSETRTLAEFLAGVGDASLPDDVRLTAKRATMDVLSACLLGSRTPEAPIYGRALGPAAGDEAAILAPDAERTSAYAASVVNTANSHQVEFSPGVARAVVHLNGVVPAALAAAERAHASGEEFLRAVVAGAESMIRFGRMVNDDPDRVPDPPDYPVAFRRGWWVPALIGPFGAAAATASVLGLDGDRFHHALGLASNLAPTATKRFVSEGRSGKGMLMGAAAGSGVMSADLAAAGIQGPEDIVGAWVPLIVGASNPKRLTNGLGSDWELQRFTFKAFPLVGTLFAPLEAAFNLLEQAPSLDVDAIESVHVGGYQRTLGFYSPDLPATSEGARSNLSFCVAAALVSGDRRFFYEEAFEPHSLGDPAIRSLAQTVSASILKEFDDLYPDQAAKARITVTLRDGTTLQADGAAITTDRYRHPSQEQLTSKLRDVWQLIDAPNAGRADELAELVWNVEALTDIRELTGSLEASLAATASATHR